MITSEIAVLLGCDEFIQIYALFPSQEKITPNIEISTLLTTTKKQQQKTAHTTRNKLRPRKEYIGHEF